jgi:hypothetical protein
MKGGKPWIYIVCKLTKVDCLSLQSTSAYYSCIQAPTLAKMRLNLLDAKVPTSGTQGSVIWLIEGISIENAQ